jgi:DNA-binding response OmpR family regulator
MAHIVLLEPDRILAETYRKILNVEGHTVVPCASAQAAIMAADQQQPDLIILEMQLIEHSGIEFLYELRSYAEWQKIPVIIHSHVPAGEFAANWNLLKDHLGVAGYLYKPLTSLRNLIKTVEHQLQGAEASQLA